MPRFDSVRVSKNVCAALAAACALLAGSASAGEVEEGFESLFDGKTLEGWDGDPKFWSVKDGAITGVTTKENPTKGNTFAIWTGGELADFELKLEYKIVPNNDKGFANSGIQYRSFRLENGTDKWRIGGYQADFEAGDRYSGICYGEAFRGILADRGQKTVIQDNGKPKVVGSVGKSDEIAEAIKKEDWNEYHVVARGYHFVHKINGVTTCELTDEDKDKRRKDGLLALQLHQGEPMTVQFRKIRLKRLDADQKGVGKNKLELHIGADGSIRLPGDDDADAVKALAKRIKGVKNAQVTIVADPDAEAGELQQAIQRLQAVGVQKFSLRAAGKKNAFQVAVSAPDKRKKVVLIAGRKSHGYGSHEHRAGSMILARALNESGLPIKAEVVTEGWPKDESVLDDADAIVIYADGGGGHPFNNHIEKINSLTEKGVGVVAIHYGVEVPKGKSGDAFLDWTGGYFEANWSVNPHWTAEFEKLPDHPITRGVKPFKINDEWYYHMRFRENMQGVKAILTDLPPDSTLTRPDGPHSGNPAVRKAVKAGEPQHTAWAREREDGGRGFGFTGGHYHWNWGHDQFRKLVLNAIAWTAKVEVPKDGVPSESLTVKDLEANQDYEKPGNYNPKRIEKLLEEWNRESRE